MACSSSRVLRWMPRRICFFCEQCEKTFHPVNPRRTGGREVHVVVRTFSQPAPDQRGLVRAVIVQNEMHLQSRGRRRLDPIEKLTELLRTVAAMQLAHDLSGLGIQRRKQRGRAMAAIIVAPPLRLSGAHGEYGLAP